MYKNIFFVVSQNCMCNFVILLNKTNKLNIIGYFHYIIVKNTSYIIIPLNTINIWITERDILLLFVLFHIKILVITRDFLWFYDKHLSSFQTRVFILLFLLGFWSSFDGFYIQFYWSHFIILVLSLIQIHDTKKFIKLVLSLWQIHHDILFHKIDVILLHLVI